MFPTKTNIIFKVKDLFSDKISGYSKAEIELKVETDDMMTTGKKLHASLKQLEFISFFEMHLDSQNEDRYSLSFLQELAAIKYTSQLNTIELLRSQKV